jgi:hypothetical protein
MESLRQAAQNKLNDTERAKEKLEADNVELYSKLRFFQGGGGSDPVSPSSVSYSAVACSADSVSLLLEDWKGSI